jgi:murein DD-endopeptidase MepM/ murein hydrolase activator NlpD
VVTLGVLLVGGSTADARKREQAYVVAPGDTIDGIAHRFGVSETAVVAGNGLIDGRLYAGSRLRISPSAHEHGTAEPFVATATRNVRTGDTVSAIARSAGIEPARLAATNGLSVRSTLKPGQRLRLPGGWACPVRGRVSFVNDWGFPRPGGRFHDGNDLMAKRGTPVVAPVGGKVTRQENRLGGRALILQGADGVRYYFAHLDSYAATGQVHRGQVIGSVGDSGAAKGGPPHLHMEMKLASALVNPYPSTKAACL